MCHLSGVWPEPLCGFIWELDPLLGLKALELFKVLASKSVVPIKQFPRDNRNRGKNFLAETHSVSRLRKYHGKQTSPHLNAASVVHFLFLLWYSNLCFLPVDRAVSRGFLTESAHRLSTFTESFHYEWLPGCLCQRNAVPCSKAFQLLEFNE